MTLDLFFDRPVAKMCSINGLLCHKIDHVSLQIGSPLHFGMKISSSSLYQQQRNDCMGKF